MKDQASASVNKFLLYFIGSILVGLLLYIIAIAPYAIPHFIPLLKEWYAENHDLVGIYAILVVILMVIALWLFLRYDKKKMDERDRSL